MVRIRFHGRGGQGIKVSSRILGTALFLEGYEVQDAPRYGAERRGAPIFAYVRAAHTPIYERGIVNRPDLVIVADESLVPLPAAGVQQGIDGHTVLLINSNEKPEVWKERLAFAGTVLTFRAGSRIEKRQEEHYIGTACAGAAARLLGTVSEAALKEAINDELGSLGSDVVDKNLSIAVEAFRSMKADEGRVTPATKADAREYIKPEWIELPFEDARSSAPVIHAAATSGKMPTGLWRTMRPQIDYERCSRCWWNCSTFCPDSAITVDKEGLPRIDYDHCKGCLICAAICPRHAIEVVPESKEKEGESK